jgi:hypothetical protein
VTGVPLPYRAVPWREVQEHMPNFSPCALSWRYKNTLFPSIIEGMFKGAKERVGFILSQRKFYFELMSRLFGAHYKNAFVVLGLIPTIFTIC